MAWLRIALTKRYLYNNHFVGFELCNCEKYLDCGAGKYYANFIIIKL